MKKLVAFILGLVITFSAVLAFAAETDYISKRDITDDLILEGDASYDEDEEAILLCPNKTWSSGKAKYPFEVLENFEVSFDYMIGGGTSADGIMLAFFAEKDSITKDGEYMNFDGCGGYGLELDTYQNTNDSPNAHVALVRDRVSNHLVMVDEPRVDDEEWHTLNIKVEGNNMVVSIDGDVIIDEYIEFDKTYRYIYFAASTGGSRDDHYIKNVEFSGRAAYSNASEWAIDEMDKAEIYDLIPEILKGQDMTKPITREEFAALSVKLYENVSEEDADVVEEPFVDTENEEVAKAYGLGITKGVSATEFAPDRKISREEVATMLTRTLKASVPELEISYANVKKFADDDKISAWAKDSVYFMVEKEIIFGMGNNIFAPKNTTTSEEATMYANSTREQALLMAVRAYEAVGE